MIAISNPTRWEAMENPGPEDREPERERRRILTTTIWAMATVALAAAALAIPALYRAAFEGQRSRLREVAQSRARIIEAVALFDARFSHHDHPAGPIAATLSQIVAAHENFEGFGETGEFTLARREGDEIVFLLSHRHATDGNPRPAPWSSDLAEPMRRALRGESGTLIGLDYRGAKVLAAHEPVSELSWGVVAKIDLAEIRAPFVRAALLAGGTALVVVAVGVVFVLRLTSPLIRRVEERSQQVKQLERLGTIGQMAGGVAHELKQPLNVIRTSSYFLRSAQGASAEKKEEHLRRIEKQVELADRAIQAMSSFSKLPMPSLRPVAVDGLVKRSLEEEPMPAGIELSIDCAPGLPPLLADPDQLEVALRNLLRNARDAMPEGGALSIRARRDGQWIEIAVADTGVGIASEEIPRVTEPLFTTKARGLGLGLAIVEAITEKHGGTLRVESEPGGGSTFALRLPLAPEPLREAGEPA